MLKFTFSKKLRLLVPNHFSFVFQKPKKIHTIYIIILGRLNTLNYPRLGLIVSKKNIKKAHERNRIKRLFRESFRLYQHMLPHMDFIIIAKKDIMNLDNLMITQILGKLWIHYYH